MLRVRIFAAAALVSAGLFAADSAQAQAQCDPTTFDNTCNGDTLTYCRNDTSVEETLNCATGFFTDGSPSSCGNLGCDGADCAQLDESCYGTAGDTCIGRSGYLAPTPSPFTALCADGFTCITRANPFGDTCVANTGGACAAGEASKGCVGTVATDCLAFASLQDATPTDYVGTDCATFGATCDASGDLPVCVVAEGGDCSAELGLVCAEGLVCNETTFLCDVADPPVGCGDVPAEGVCNGNSVQYCDEDVNEVVDIDCDTLYPDTTATCGQFGAFANCLLPDDAQCVYFVNDQAQAYPCQDGSGCVIGDTAADSVCVGGLGTCTDPAEGAEYASVCIGADVLNYGCTGGQPLSARCGGSCSNGACIDSPVGDYCDGTEFVCAAGLVCADNACSEVAADGGVIDPGPNDGGINPIDPNADAGTPPVRPDAGTPDNDAGTPDNDAGTPGDDAGTPGTDAGTVDPEPSPQPDTPEPSPQPDTPEPAAQPDTPEPSAEPEAQPEAPPAEPAAEPAAEPSAEPENDPGEDPPAEGCSHTGIPAQGAASTGLFAALFLGLVVRRRRR